MPRLHLPRICELLCCSVLTCYCPSLRVCVVHRFISLCVCTLFCWTVEQCIKFGGDERKDSAEEN